ncbi:MAG: alpha/beta fold hydrolase [Armatimonadetes bacterium]|nr:alpha/beta fold hydrolase [Armatimonadota bacterium]
MSAVAIALLYIGILVLVALAALKPARSPIYLSPEALGAKTEDVEFESDGRVLKGWWVLHDSPRAVAILMHGYVMNRSENSALAAALNRKGFACLLFDSRGSGKSDGSRVGMGWLERTDVVAACRFAQERLSDVPRVLIGASMGAAAAAFALAETPDCADALVLDSSYHSLARATLGWWRFVGGSAACVGLGPVVLVAGPFAGFNPFKVNVGRALASIKKPVLILHGRKDNLAAPFHAERNYRSATMDGSKNVRIIWFDEAGHVEARWTRPEEYVSQIEQFLVDMDVVKPAP